MTLQSACLQVSECLMSEHPLEKCLLDTGLWGMGKQQRNLLFLPHSKQHESSSQKQPSFTDSSDLLIAWWAHTSFSLSGLYGERYVYWFLKTNNSMEWEYLQETHMKWRMPQSCIFRIVQQSENLFFIINENIFLDGVCSLTCSILEWRDRCLQCMLSGQTANEGSCLRGIMCKTSGSGIRQSWIRNMTLIF